MSKFLSSLIVADDFGLPFELCKDLSYESDKLKRVIVVPGRIKDPGDPDFKPGFLTDLASIPLGMWNILPKSGRYDRAAVVHDYLYQFNGCTRAEADAVLKEAMEVLQVGGFRIFMIYSGVRSGGWKSWNRYRKAENAQTGHLQ